MALLLALVLVAGITTPSVFADDDDDEKDDDRDKDDDDEKSTKFKKHNVHTGDGPPPGALGNVGDLYIDSSDTDNLVIYKKTAKKTWTNVGGFEGSQGPPGEKGDAGEPGQDGLNCWDLDGDGTKDLPDEDTNGDGIVDVLDCKGSAGEQDLQSQLSALQARLAFLESFLDLSGLVRTSDGGMILPITIDGTVKVTWTPHAVITDSGSSCNAFDSCPIFQTCGPPTCISFTYWRTGHAEWTGDYTVEVDNVENLPQSLLVDDLTTFSVEMLGNDQNDFTLKINTPDGNNVVLAPGTQTLSPTSTGSATIQLDGSDGLLTRLSATLESTMPAQANIGCTSSSPCNPSLPPAQTFTESATSTIQIKIIP